MEFKFEKKIKKLVKLLSNADSKFATAQKSATWSEWYAAQLKSSGIDKVIGISLPTKNLSMLLEQAREFYHKERPQVSHNEYIADFLFNSMQIHFAV